MSGLYTAGDQLNVLYCAHPERFSDDTVSIRNMTADARGYLLNFFDNYLYFIGDLQAAAALKVFFPTEHLDQLFKQVLFTVAQIHVM